MRRYHGFIADSARWEGFRFRDDDILICTPAKSGTTWMQTIVAMLVLGRPRLQQPMGLLSPWLDMNTRSVDDVFALLEAQNHRRFIKTHTPLDGIPWDDRVTYLVVTRHPLHVARSMEDHMANMDMERSLEIRAAAVGLDDLENLTPRAPREGDARERLLGWVLDDDADPNDAAGMASLRNLVEHVRTYWDVRDRPNVHLFHYDDLCRDRDGQMRRVAAALGIPVPDDWADYVAAAGYDRMRAAADLLAPDSQLRPWFSNQDFFRSGGDRRVEDFLPDDLATFEDRLLDLAGPELAAWMLEARRDPVSS